MAKTHFMVRLFFFPSILEIRFQNLLVQLSFRFSNLGGSKGFADVIWTAKNYKKDSHVTFTYDSFDGEEGNIYSLYYKNSESGAF